MGHQIITKGFWEHLASHKKPFFVLAPMADVTDCVFRQIITAHSKPDVLWTEFVSADGLSSPAGRKALLVDFQYTEAERPIVAQIFGSNEEHIEAAARLCAELHFDGIDINMGCPDRSIEKSESGAYCIRHPDIAKRIVLAARRGAPHLPVSVKTRIGYNKLEWEWIREVLSWQLPAVTFHLRTRKEMSLVPAHWDLMKEIVRLRDEISPETLVIGNGDVVNLEDARKKYEESGVDGLMLGRAIFGNPWLFDESKKEITISEKLTTMLQHTKLFVELLGQHKNFAIMKKHYKAYVNGFPGAKELRVSLMDAPDYETIKNYTEEFLNKHASGEITLTP
jgi:nifR3 family TIM-barrel protein